MNRYKYIDEGRSHLHTLDGKPLIGTTTAKGIVGKGEGLMQWYADMSAVEGLALPQQDIREEYQKIQLITDKIQRAKAKKELDFKYPDYVQARKAAVTYRDKSAGEGSIRHGVLEDWIRLCIKNGGTPNESLPHELVIEDFVKWSVENVGMFCFTEGHCYHEGLWVGGISDLGLLLKNGKRLVGDHKSSKEAYPDQFLQCALYDLELNHSGVLDADGNKIMDWPLADGYVVFPFRSKPFTPEFRWNAQDYRKAGEDVVGLYKLLELN